MPKIFSTTFLIVFVLSYLSPTIGNAIDPATSGRILDNFKREQADILFESSPLDSSDASKILEQEYAMNGLDSLKNRLQTMQSAYQVKKDAVSEVRVSLEKALEILAESIRFTTESINKTNIDITNKQIKIQQLRAVEISLRARIAQHRAIILAYLTNIYSEGNSILDTLGNVDIIK